MATARPARPPNPMSSAASSNSPRARRARRWAPSASTRARESGGPSASASTSSHAGSDSSVTFSHAAALRVVEHHAAAPDGLVASRTHLTILSAILLGIAAAGYLTLSGPAAGAGSPAGAALYLPLLAAEWGLFVYVRMGMKRRGVAVTNLISARPLSLRALATDLLLGLLLLGLWLGVEYLLDRL